MTRYAVAVVILPPEQVMNLAISFNRQLSGLINQPILLNETDVLPHISLLMGCITNEALTKGAAVIEQVVNTAPAIPLEITGLRFTDASPPVAALNIRLTPQLAGWQNMLLKAFRPLLTQDTVEDDLFDPPPVSRSSIDWINHFIPDQCGERFWPHITLGHGQAPFDQPPIAFIATRLAICHLGNHCTCRSVLAQASVVK